MVRDTPDDGDPLASWTLAVRSFASKVSMGAWLLETSDRINNMRATSIITVSGCDLSCFGAYGQPIYSTRNFLVP